MIEVEKIIPGGMALGTNSDGKKIFFWNALPGEQIEDFDIIKNKSHFTEAIATKISNPSNFRVEPKDDCFLSTSPWQIMDFSYENQIKVELVKEIFRQQEIQTTGFWSFRNDGSGMSDEPHNDGREEASLKTSSCISGGKDYFYRNKMEYALYWDNELQKISLAFHTRGSHRKIPIKNSSIERPEIFQAANKIINELNQNHAEARNYQSLILRCNQKGEVSGGLYENHKPHPVFNTLNDQILGKTYSYSPNGFFQINLPVYEMALSQIKKHITTDKVLDLYAGVGTIGLSVASDKILTLVEVDKSAFTELCKNITTSGTPEDIIRTIRFESVCDNESNRRSEPRNDGRERGGSKKESFNNIMAELAKSEDVTNYIEPDMTVIVDPPRAGCDIKLINKLNEIKPEKIIYLSCNPSTQARDIKYLLENYKITDIQTFNFFPHTPHIENLVILQRNK